jgi:outer membrane protein assembly factor BamC
MMTSRTVLPVILAAAFVNLTACSYIQGLFPDKEKDYQYTTEIPPLVVPPQLSENPVFKRPETASAETAPPDVATSARMDNSFNEDNLPPIKSEHPAGSGTDAEPASKIEPNASGQARSETESSSSEPVSPEPEARPEDAAPAEAGGSAETAAPSAEPDDQTSAKSEAMRVEFVVYDDGESRLRIPAGKVVAWNEVGKALSRNSLEVIERNAEDGLFIVRYDPEEKQYKEESFLDEFLFIFGGVEARDNQYWLKLAEDNRRTDLAVLNRAGKPVASEAALRLLKLIQKTINADQAR